MSSPAAFQDEKVSREIRLRWAVRSDIPAITRLLNPFFLELDLYNHFCPKGRQKPEEFQLWCLQRVRGLFVKKAFRFMVAEAVTLTITGEEKEVVGLAAWDAQGDEQNPIRKAWLDQDSSWTMALERQLLHVESLHHRYLRNTIYDYAAFASIWKQLEAASGHDERLRNNMHLQFLLVPPEWRKGYGIGKKLWQWGVDVAGKVGLPIVVESSVIGYPFYLKMGCRLVKMVRVDWKPEKAFDVPVVVYDPRDVSQTWPAGLAFENES